MYESFFKFTRRPFTQNPAVENYFAASTIEQSRQILTGCVERNSGPAVIIGRPGVGKTLLLHMMARQYQESFEIALLGGAGLCTRRALLQNILFELKQPYRDMEEGELRLSLFDYLESAKNSSGLLLLVDEAHTLPSRLIEELRLLTNFVRGGESRIRLILSGGMALEENLASPDQESFNQRIAGRCYLQTLSYDETGHYVKSQLACVDADPDAIVDEQVISALYSATDGVPRLINQVMDQALTIAFNNSQPTLSPSLVQEAWAELQQLPTPWTGNEEFESNQESNSVVVEFGELDDEEFGDSNFETPLPEANVDPAPVEEIESSPEPPSLACNPFDEQFEDEEVIVKTNPAVIPVADTSVPQLPIQPTAPVAAEDTLETPEQTEEPAQPQDVACEVSAETIEEETLEAQAEASPLPFDYPVEDDINDFAPTLGCCSPDTPCTTRLIGDQFPAEMPQAIDAPAEPATSLQIQIEQTIAAPLEDNIEEVQQAPTEEQFEESAHEPLEAATEESTEETPATESDTIVTGDTDEPATVLLDDAESSDAGQDVPSLPSEDELVAEHTRVILNDFEQLRAAEAAIDPTSSPFEQIPLNDPSWVRDMDGELNSVFMAANTESDPLLNQPGLMDVLADPSTDPVLPPTSGESLPEAQPSPYDDGVLLFQGNDESPAYSLRVASTDDRDIIVVEDADCYADDELVAGNSQYVDLLTRMRRDK